MTDNNKVTREQRKRVEELQKLEREIYDKQCDLQELGGYIISSTGRYLNYSSEYARVVRRYIKHQILKLKRKRKEMISYDR